MSDPPLETRPPRAGELLPLLVIAPAIWAFVRLAAVTSLVDPWVSLALAAAAGGLFGIPALFWALDHDRATPVVLGLLGAIAGALVPAAFVVSAASGFLARQGLEAARWLLGRHAIFPLVGAVSWTSFVLIDLEAACSGALAGLVSWALVARRRPASRLR